MRLVYISIAALAIVVGVFVGYYIWGPETGFPPVWKYDLFKDVLAIVLAVIAVGVAAFSYLFYRMALGHFEIRANKILARIETRAAETLETTRQEMIAGISAIGSRLYLGVGYAYWTDYKKCRERGTMETEEQKRKLAEEEAKQYLELAIALTKEAYDRYASKLDEQQRANQGLIGMIRNNLGYYLAERGNPEDREFARQCAEYIRGKIVDFPTAQAKWGDTCNFILKQYPEGQGS